MNDSKLQLLLDRADISNVIVSFVSCLDTQKWDFFHSLFTNEINVDYSELTGKPDSKMKADDFVAFVRSSLSRKGLKTQHISTNYTINLEGDNATCVSSVAALHYLPDEQHNTFDAHGYYNKTLVRTSKGWKISGIKLSFLWATGNSQLLNSP